ncbi:MAG: rhomboid family intramembrane serine protease [Oscillospiraceae bacterium]|nr:rhomboid family intramembrane serine protease [Oscillospiraceae bacterium]
MNILNKMERKFGRYYISNLMLYIVIGTGIVFAFQYLFPTLPLWQLLTFNRDAILHGQIWRVISFILVPVRGDPISMLFWLYLYWFIGSNLESYWGGWRFNIYYFTGALLAAVGGFITGLATNEYLNLSLFLAMAILCPNNQLLLFFFIPIKMKWLALVYAAMVVHAMWFVGWGGRLAIVLSLLNVALFFGGDFFRKIRNKFKYHKVQSNFKKNMKMTQNKDDR